MLRYWAVEDSDRPALMTCSTSSIALTFSRSRGNGCRETRMRAQPALTVATQTDRPARAVRLPARLIRRVD
jgi:hypothetical protein